jgi:hypothetical protein
MERLLVVAKEPHNRFQLEFARLTALLESEKSKVAKLERLVEASARPKELMENDVEEGRSAGWNIHVHQAMRDLEMSDDTDNMVFLEGSERLHPSTAQVILGKYYVVDEDSTKLVVLLEDFTYTPL